MVKPYVILDVQMVQLPIWLAGATWIASRTSAWFRYLVPRKPQQRRKCG